MRTSKLEKYNYKSIIDHPFCQIVSSSEIENWRELLDNKIKLLSEDSSKQLWKDIFNCVEERRFFPSDHWINKNEWCQLGINWLPFYNDDQAQPVANELKRLATYSLDSSVFYFKDPFEVIETTWNLFTDYWMLFFEYDDESYIWSQFSNDLLLVTPLGGIRKIRRN